MKISQTMTNLEIAELLRSVAASYKLKDENKNKFRIVAYERAADAVEHATSELKDLWDDGKLDEIPGVGKSLMEHLGEIFQTGRSKHFEEVMRGLPPIMFEFMEIPGIGAKTAFRLAHELGLHSLKELEKAAEKGHIAKLEGFGERSQQEILTSLKESKNKVKRNLLPYAFMIAEEIKDYMKLNEDAVRVDALGSLRRMSSTVGDIDIAVSTKKPASVLTYFTAYPKSKRIIEQGNRTASILLPGNIRVDLMAEKPEAYGALLQHFTGSKHHNIALREFALKKNLSLSDYGIYTKPKNKKNKELKKFSTEQDFYNYLGMDYIEPELREDTGEIKAALNHKLPVLVELQDIKADFHIHSDFDIETSHDLGESDMEQLVLKAESLGYEYISLSEHNPSQRGHNEKEIYELILKKKDAISKLNERLRMNGNPVKHVFNSLEIDIKPNGSLPLTDKAFNELDFALVSVHSSFGLNKNDMTKRILNGLSHPKARIFAHPTARKLNEREGIELDWPVIFDFCLKNNKWIEVNCDAMRLDLPDILVREAVKYGVKIILGTDAHHKDHLSNMPWGLSVARRGWAEKTDVINCLSLEEFKKEIEST
jgi:DNA polymerase (family X)